MDKVDPRKKKGSAKGKRLGRVAAPSGSRQTFRADFAVTEFCGSVAGPWRACRKNRTPPADRRYGSRLPSP